MKRKTRLRLIASLTAAVMLPMAAEGATSTEFWPELDLWVAVSKPARLLFTLAGTRDREDGDKTDSTVGVYFDYRAGEHTSYRAGYVYVRGLASEPGESDSIERRLVLDFNYRWRLSEHALLVDRTRLDLRDRDDEDSHRVRNRLLLTCETKVREFALTPYASIEAFYDSRFDEVSRIRLEGGVVIPRGRHVEWDLYVGRQRDSQSVTQYTNGIGVTFSLIY